MPTQIDDAYQTWHRDLVLQFLTDLMTATIDTPTPEAFQQATQAFCTALEPWVDPADTPLQPRSVFCLFTECTFDERGETATICLSPEGEAYFRAWARQHVMLTEAGLFSPDERSH